MQSQPEAPERVVLTNPLGSRCGSQGHREAVTEDLCGAGGLALCSLPGRAHLCLSPPRAPGSTCDRKIMGGGAPLSASPLPGRLLGGELSVTWDGGSGTWSPSLFLMMRRLEKKVWRGSIENRKPAVSDVQRSAANLKL